LQDDERVDARALHQRLRASAIEKSARCRHVVPSARASPRSSHQHGDLRQSAIGGGVKRATRQDAGVWSVLLSSRVML
jgi:hypothetical protein